MYCNRVNDFDVLYIVHDYAFEYDLHDFAVIVEVVLPKAKAC